jgi:hypothetical protein
VNECVVVLVLGSEGSISDCCISDVFICEHGYFHGVEDVFEFIEFVGIELEDVVVDLVGCRGMRVICKKRKFIK